MGELEIAGEFHVDKFDGEYLMKALLAEHVPLRRS